MRRKPDVPLDNLLGESHCPQIRGCTKLIIRSLPLIFPQGGFGYVIRSIWVVERISGRCLFERTYGKKVAEADFIPMILSAVSSLSDFGLEGDRISTIVTEGIRWIYRYVDPLIFVVTGAKGDPESHLKAQINYLGNAFLQMFPKLKGKDATDFLKNWSGAASDFQGYRPLADQLVQQWSQISEVNKAAKALDVLEIYQKIFDAILTGIPSGSYKVWSELGLAVDEFCDKCKASVRHKLSEPNPVLDLISIDAFSVNYDTLKTSLSLLLGNLVEILKKNLPIGEAERILRSRVIPIMKRDWKRIDVYSIDRVLVSLL
jgi:hypothetical protein